MGENERFRKEILPLYDKMVFVFTENFWLANPSTQNWYADLSEYVDLWHRWLDELIAPEVMEELDHSEKKLEAFYDDLENQLENLRNKIVRS